MKKVFTGIFAIALMLISVETAKAGNFIIIRDGLGNPVAVADNCQPNLNFLPFSPTPSFGFTTFGNPFVPNVIVTNRFGFFGNRVFVDRFGRVHHFRH